MTTPTALELQIFFRQLLASACKARRTPISPAAEHDRLRTDPCFSEQVGDTRGSARNGRQRMMLKIMTRDAKGASTTAAVDSTSFELHDEIIPAVARSSSVRPPAISVPQMIEQNLYTPGDVRDLAMLSPQTRVNLLRPLEDSHVRSCPERPPEILHQRSDVESAPTLYLQPQSRQRQGGVDLPEGVYRNRPSLPLHLGGCW